MEKDFLESRRCKCYTTDFELDYYLVKNGDAQGGIAEYGVEVQKTVDGKIEESACEYNVFHTRDRGEQFIRTLAENTVTPATLHDVVEDFA